MAALLVTVLAGLGLGGASGWMLATPQSGRTVTIVNARSFDPYGSGPSGENDTLLSKLFDKNRGTDWTTETYVHGLTKLGVGVILEVSDNVPLRDLSVVTGNRGWTLQAFVSPAPHADLAGWGAPVAEVVGVGASERLDLHGRAGRFVLCWITDLGPNNQARIAEVSVRSES